MMPYTIEFNQILPNIHCMNRKQALSEIATRISRAIDCDDSAFLERLLENEGRDSSACGDGVAIPHLKIKGLPGRFVALATLDRPVDFEADDGQGVDIICVLLSPERDGPIHLRGLSRITRMFKNETLRDNLRGTKDADAIRSLLINPEGWLLAA